MRRLAQDFTGKSHVPMGSSICCQVFCSKDFNLDTIWHIKQPNQLTSSTETSLLMSVHYIQGGQQFHLTPRPPKYYHDSGKRLFACISLASFYESIGHSADPDKTPHNTNQDLPTVCLQNLLLKLEKNGNTIQHP